MGVSTWSVFTNGWLILDANRSMYIKDETFSNEDSLLEALFDFSLGETTAFVNDLLRQIEIQLEANETYKAYHASLTDEEDRLELETEERRIRLAEALMEHFDTFEIKQRKLFGLKGTEKILLYEIDLV